MCAEQPQITLPTPPQVERFRRRLELLSQGRLVEAQSLVVGTSAGAKKAGGELIDEAMELGDGERLGHGSWLWAGWVFVGVRAWVWVWVWVAGTGIVRRAQHARQQGGGTQTSGRPPPSLLPPSVDVAEGAGAAARDYDVSKALRQQAKRARGAAACGPRAPCHMSAQTLGAIIDTIGEFFRRQPAAGKCQNCGAHNPTIKK